MAAPPLTLVEDPEAIRTALGVSALDVTDPIIQNHMIGYLAEVKIKAKVPYWAAVMDGSRYAADAAKAFDQKVRLKAAANYYAAALIARRLENGAIPLIAGGNASGIPVDWKEKAKEMFAWAYTLIGELTSADTGTTPDPALPSTSFAMSHGTPRSTWMTDPPIAHIMHPLNSENWDDD